MCELMKGSHSTVGRITMEAVEEGRNGAGERAYMQAPIRVLLDARKLQDGGIGTYLRNLIAGLRVRPDVVLTVLVRSEEARDPLVKDLPQVVTKSGLYSLHELFCLGREISWGAFSIFHTPHFVLPLFVPVPAVVTIHDLNHFFHPERFYYPLIATPYIAHALARSRGVVAVSQQSYHEVERFCCGVGGIMKKVRVIPNAVAPLEEDPALSSREDPYLLSVISTDKPHKGVTDLLGAFEQIALEFPLLQLRIVGAGTPKSELVPRELASRVLLEGKLPASVLWERYRGARGVVVSSLQEGFCLPLIEAHAVGTPVVARPIPAVRALSTPDDSIAADMTRASFVAAIRGLLERPVPPRHRLVEHAAQYSVSTVTEQTVALYREALQ